MNRQLYWAYNPSMKCPNGRYVYGYIHLEDGEVLREVEYIRAKDIIQLLNEELESANYHSMMDMYTRLYSILANRLPAEEIDLIFRDIWDKGGIIDD